jgi:malate dehydrogenase
MVDAISNNRRRQLPCVSTFEGGYGENDIAMGVPCLLAERGLNGVIELPLNELEPEQFRQSAATVRTDIDRLK